MAGRWFRLRRAARVVLSWDADSGGGSALDAGAVVTTSGAVLVGATVVVLVTAPVDGMSGVVVVQPVAEVGLVSLRQWRLRLARLAPGPRKILPHSHFRDPDPVRTIVLIPNIPWPPAHPIFSTSPQVGQRAQHIRRYVCDSHPVSCRRRADTASDVGVLFRRYMKVDIASARNRGGRPESRNMALVPLVATPTNRSAIPFEDGE